jgi:hypothetical protein
MKNIDNNLFSENIHVRVCDEAEAWSMTLNDFNYSLFIIPEWIKSLQTTQRRPVYIDFLLNNEVIAKLAGLQFDTDDAYKRKLYFHAGPAVRLNADHSLHDKCLNSLVRYAKRNDIARIVLLSYDYKHKSCVKRPFHFSIRQELIVDLTPDKEQIHNKFSRSFLGTYKKAIKEGCVFSENGSIAMVDTLADLLEETKKIRLSKGYEDYNPYYIPLFNKNSLISLIQHGAVRIFLAKKELEICAIFMALSRGNKAYGLLTGTSKEGYKAGAPSFLEYCVLMTFKNEGIQYLNLGGIPLENVKSGLVQFKKSIGAFPVESTYGSTNFLRFPYNLLNPIMSLARILPANKIVKIVQQKI